MTEPKILGCFSLKSERTGKLDEAFRIGSEMVAPKDRIFSQVDPKSRTAIMWPHLAKKEKDKVNLSPTSYEPLAAYKKTQLINKNFSLAKSPRKAMITN